MPYITKQKRAAVAIGRIETAGELNYAITNLIVNYLKERPLNYSNLNEVMGVLESAKFELYRQKIAPYENVKQTENGDVYK